MAELPITSRRLVSTPASPAGHDAYSWRVEIGDVEVLVVELSGAEAVETGMGTEEIHERMPAALQRWAARRLRSDVPVVDQVGGWNSPIMLLAEHFR